MPPVRARGLRRSSRVAAVSEAGWELACVELDGVSQWVEAPVVDFVHRCLALSSWSGFGSTPRLGHAEQRARKEWSRRFLGIVADQQRSPSVVEVRSMRPTQARLLRCFGNRPRCCARRSRPLGCSTRGRPAGVDAPAHQGGMQADARGAAAQRPAARCSLRPSPPCLWPAPAATPPWPGWRRYCRT